LYYFKGIWLFIDEWNVRSGHGRYGGTLTFRRDVVRPQLVEVSCKIPEIFRLANEGDVERMREQSGVHPLPISLVFCQQLGDSAAGITASFSPAVQPLGQHEQPLQNEIVE
jgi:hypothetical protein